jgi:hypothetical protein
VIVVADRLPAAVAPGEALALDVHVVSDLRIGVDGAEVTARLHWEGGERSWRWSGDVPADACQRVGTMQIVAPHADGELVLELECRHPSGTARNEYRSLLSG